MHFNRFMHTCFRTLLRVPRAISSPKRPARDWGQGLKCEIWPSILFFISLLSFISFSILHDLLSIHTRITEIGISLWLLIHTQGIFQNLFPFYIYSCDHPHDLLYDKTRSLVIFDIALPYPHPHSIIRLSLVNKFHISTG